MLRLSAIFGKILLGFCSSLGSVRGLSWDAQQELRGSAGLGSMTPLVVESSLCSHLNSYCNHIICTLLSLRELQLEL